MLVEGVRVAALVVALAAETAEVGQEAHQVLLV
jgi:hypothetical protein